MPTQTASLATPTAVAPKLNAGVFAQPISYNSAATAFEASATTILLCKVPDQTNIIDVGIEYSCGAATAPGDIGVTGDLSALATGGTIGTRVVTKVGSLPYKVSLSDDSVGYTYLTLTLTAGTATASVKANGFVLLQSD